MIGKVALEEHFVVNDPEHIARWRTLVRNMPAAAMGRFVPALTDLGDARLEAMDEAGIELSVLSNVATVQGQLDAETALRIARKANDALAEAVRARPDRYAGFATVPLQDPAVGADELERAVTELGLCGAVLLGQTNGEYLDHDRFSVFWERLEGLDVPVYLHAADAAEPPASYAGRPELMGPWWSWTAETATHTLRIVVGGVFDRFPRARLILGHLGEGLPFLLWRLDARIRAFADHGPADMPSAIIRRNVAVTTAGMFADEPLLCSLSALGEDNVMFSVDHPFEDSRPAADWFEQAPLTDTVRAKVASGNAKALLRL